MTGILSSNVGRASGLKKAPAAGGLVLIDTDSADDVASMEVEGISTTYDQYLIILDVTRGAARTGLSDGNYIPYVQLGNGSGWLEAGGSYRFTGNGSTLATDTGSQGSVASQGGNSEVYMLATCGGTRNGYIMARMILTPNINNSYLPCSLTAQATGWSLAGYLVNTCGSTTQSFTYNPTKIRFYWTGGSTPNIIQGDMKLFGMVNS